jgi:hypothetical protein
MKLFVMMRVLLIEEEGQDHGTWVGSCLMKGRVVGETLRGHVLDIVLIIY